MREDLLEKIVNDIESLKILHHHYVSSARLLELSLLVTLPGEVVTLVGPSRAGKTQLVKEATRASYPCNDGISMPVVYVEAENASRDGEFSSKAFMVACLRAVHHPIYGRVSGDFDDERGVPLRFKNVTEATLRDAFETTLIGRSVKVFIVDEAHHVEYIRGGIVAAARMLDSLKCLASKTGVKLVLAGSYKLLDIVSHAPHFLGRQLPMEFPRYRSEFEQDVVEWKRIILAFSEPLAPFAKADEMQGWAKLLFEGSFGCVGHLSLWLRAAMAKAVWKGREVIIEEDLIATRIPEHMSRSIVNEIKAGEKAMETIHVEAPAKTVRKVVRSRRTRPFQRNARRSPRGGRSQP
jgi:hypothetical protein